MSEFYVGQEVEIIKDNSQWRHSSPTVGLRGVITELGLKRAFVKITNNHGAAEHSVSFSQMKALDIF